MAIRHSFADMSKFATQPYYSTAVKLLHCFITDTSIIHNIKIVYYYVYY